MVPSCTLMMKQEWPLLLTQNENIKKLSKNVFEISEYIVKLNKEGLLSKPHKKLENFSVTLHHACHSRAQNFGFKAKEMLSLVEGVEIKSIEKCSGHGGPFGI
jgi:glycerol-3-phosphate dehydrogenase subunit C